MMSTKRPRVAALMSGGVDSSVMAWLLLQQGYDVVGVTLQLWDYETAARKPRGERGCCDITHQMDARFVCSQIGIDHVMLDLRREFLDQVVRPYEQTYLSGSTPNPCVWCNSRLKWGAVMKKAAALEADYVATGHYARILRSGGRVRLVRGVDLSKDQSYALWEVPREAIAKTLLPLGEWTKREIRAKAAELKLRTADKAESQEVCFIPDHYEQHLREQYPERVAEIGEGEIVDGEGRVLGHHRGFYTFTIGQRRGLDISDGRGPYYVNDLDPRSNRVVVGGRGALARTGLVARNVNWVSFDPPSEPERCRVKIRYNDPEGFSAWLIPGEDGSVEVRFDEPVHAVTPGQSAVWYRDDAVWGGGMIVKALKDQWKAPEPEAEREGGA